MLAAAVTVRKLRQTGTATPEEILDLTPRAPSSPHLQNPQSDHRSTGE
jgi:hypothetical protein